MNRADVAKRVKKVISKVMSISEDQISDTANFIFDLGADSQQSIELVAAFQEEFDIEMDEDQALGIQTVDNAVDFIAAFLKK
jgi:acyl carrier protein